VLTLGDAPRALKACELSLTAENAAELWLKPYAIALIGCGKDTEAIDRLETYLSDFSSDDDGEGWLIGALTRTGHREEALARILALSAGSGIRGMSPEQISDSFLFTGLSEVVVCQGHTGWITCIDHSPKSGSFVTGARDRTIKFWDQNTGAEIKTFSVVGQPPASLRISPNERLLAISAAQVGLPVKILDLESGKFTGSLLGHEGMVTALGFSPDGKHILTTDQKGSARLWDANDFKAIATFKVPVHSAAAIYFDDESRPGLFLACMDRTVKKIYPIDSVAQTFEKIHKEAITAVRVRADGTRVLTCSKDKQVLVWNGTTGEVSAMFQAPHDQITEVALNPIRDLVATYDPKGGIKIWDCKIATVTRNFLALEGEINCLTFTADGERILAGGRDMVLRVWDVRGRPIVPTLALAKIRPVKKQMKSDKKFKVMIDAAKKAMQRGAFATAYSMLRDSQTLLGHERSDVALDLILRLKDYGSRIGVHGAWKWKSVDAQCGVMDVVFSSSAIAFLTAQSDHTVRIWSTKTGDCLKVLKGHTNLVAAIALSLNGREAASGSDDRTVRTWDLNSGKNLLTLKGHTESVTAVSYSPDGNTLASGSWDNTLRLWRLPDGYPIKTLKGHDDKVSSVDFINNEHIVSAGFDGVVRMWEASTGRLLRELKGHKDKVTCLSVSAKRELLLTGSMDGTARLWDAKTGNCIKVIEVHESGMRAVGFSPDQKFVVTGANDAILRMWSVATGKCLREFQGHLREITAARFSSDCRLVITSSVDGVVMIWEVDWSWKFANRKQESAVD
jgi:WD40 repeat protein